MNIIGDTDAWIGYTLRNTNAILTGRQRFAEVSKIKFPTSIEGLSFH